ncbi:MAG: Aralkylamine dehydrogenase heavy chain [Steroidobacteraceae bacterium]|nr:Aralkylamine dehydrogenase heavy chain [Steroidobacteraceae bacterium]
MNGTSHRALKKASICLGAIFATTVARAELPAEPIPNVETLSVPYPESMVFVHDVNMFGMIAGKISLVDVASENRNFKGMLDAAQFASFAESRTRGELYVAETHYSRGTRGDRSDVLTVYDKRTLKQTAEIPLPGGKRALIASNRYTMQLVDNDRFLFLFNFTPAASVSMIDLQARKILSETQIPGCGLIYPTGKRGFSSLCSNGSMFSAQFDETGKLLKQKTLPPFFDVDEDPLFGRPVLVNGTAYFPSFKGQVRVIDLSQDSPQIGKSWSLLSDDDRGENWRPGGYQVGTANDAGLIYILMHPGGADGSHKNGGSEVWVFDPVLQKRVQRVKLEKWGLSIEVTRGKSPYLVVVNSEMQLDIYDANNGKWLKMIGGTALIPVSMFAVRQ